MRRKQAKPPPDDLVQPKATEEQKDKEWSRFWNANHSVATVVYGFTEEQVKAVWSEAYASSGRRPTWHELYSVNI